MTSTAPIGELTRKGHATRERIIDAASRLILLNGVVHTRLDDVGAAAQVGRSQLYHYFDSKTDLVEAVIARYAGEVFGHRGPRFPVLTDWPSWWAWRDAMIETQRAHAYVGGCPLGSLVSELSDIDEHARQALEVVFLEWREQLLAGLGSLAEHGELRTPVPLDRLATMILAALEGGLLLTQLHKDVAPLEAALDGVFALLGAPERDAPATDLRPA